MHYKYRVEFLVDEAAFKESDETLDHNLITSLIEIYGASNISNIKTLKTEYDKK